MDLHTIFLSTLVVALLFLTTCTSIDLILTKYSYKAGRRAVRNMLLMTIVTAIITFIWIFI